MYSLICLQILCSFHFVSLFLTVNSFFLSLGFFVPVSHLVYIGLCILVYAPPTYASVGVLVYFSPSASVVYIHISCVHTHLVCTYTSRVYIHTSLSLSMCIMHYDAHELPPVYIHVVST
eukprot:GHVS01036745.1.p1 GENE.GHVS01036745.1~~GHVS01036745.1.p1  ORF type:complete len:119 (-),score=4.00 GHVS01036745.1:868-1224(-)